MTNLIAATKRLRVRGADLLVDSLISAGVETIFGLPGDTGVVFYDALYAATDRLHHVLARDERHAVVMADAYARVCNRVGVAEVSSGGGVVYAVGGLGEAYASGCPILLITSDIHSASRNTGALTEIDQLGLFAAVSKWQTIVSSASAIPSAVADALRSATTGRPGPVVIIIPEDVLDESVERPAALGLGRSDTLVPRTRTVADPVAVSIAAAMLGTADRPAIVAGSGVHSSEAWAALALVAEKAAIPVATTIHGKGAIADTNPWSLGVVGNNGGGERGNNYIRAADAVLFVGTRANATDTSGWTLPPRTGVKIAQIDIDDGRAGRNYVEAVRLIGDARVTLAAIGEAIETAPSRVREQRSSSLVVERERWRAAEVDGAPPVTDGNCRPLR